MLSSLNMLKRTMMVMMSVFLLSSCAHGAKAVKPVKISEPAPVVIQDVPAVSGSVIDAETLAKGGKIGLVVFKAGPNAEATDELDKIALMINKGIKDSVDGQKGSLQVVDPADEQPVIALQGYINEYSKKTGKMRRMMLRPNEASLDLVGEVWLISNGQRLLSFSTDKRFDPKKQKPIDVAYALGKEIGDYVGSYAK